MNKLAAGDETDSMPCLPAVNGHLGLRLAVFKQQ